MKKQMLLTLAALPLLAGVNIAHADSVTVGSESTISVDGKSYTLVSAAPDYSGVMWEDNGSGGYQACGCRMSAFRALQAVGDYLHMNDTFSTSAISIRTGWNTDGPEEMYLETLGWEQDVNFSYASPITDNKYLTLADSWYEFTTGGHTYRVSLDASIYEFTPNTSHTGYHYDWDFFDYRTFAKTTPGIVPEKDYFKTVVKPQLVVKLEGAAQFDVQPVPIPGAIWLLGSGLAGLVFTGKRKKQ